MYNNAGLDIRFPSKEWGLQNKVERILFSLLEWHFSLANQTQVHLNSDPYQPSQPEVSHLSKIK